MSYTTQQDILDFVEDNNVKFVRFAFCDIFGTQKNIAVLAGDLLLGIYSSDAQVLRYGMLPYVTVKYLMKVKLDGKNPVKYFCGYLRFLFTRKECIERFRICRDHGVTVRINWNCGRRLE